MDRFEVEDFHTYIAGGVRVHNQSVFIATGRDLDVGSAYTNSRGQTLQINADGSITNLATRKVTPAGEYSQGKYLGVAAAEWDQSRNISPAEQYEMAGDGAFASQVTKQGSGPTVTIASGKKLAAGTEWTSTSGYRYRVNADGSSTNLDTKKQTSPATSQTEQAKPYKSGATSSSSKGDKSSSASTSVTIKKGDTLSGIAAKGDGGAGARRRQ